MKSATNYNFCLAPCGQCAIWKELSTDLSYRNPAGITIPTMGGRAAPLIFRFDPIANRVHVWRPKGNPKFSFGESECVALCQRYISGLKMGELPNIHELGGTSYFTDPKWPKRILGRKNTPYAAAVIRHALKNSASLASSICCSPIASLTAPVAAVKNSQ
jgi:hypothetical protein